MMTARAEYRLHLRQDNADQRLTEIGHRIGLISDERYERFLKYCAQVDSETARMETVFVGQTPESAALLEKYGSTPLKSGATLAELIRRPELSYEALAPLDPARPEDLPERVAEQVNIRIKYAGYIERQMRQVEQFRKMEKKTIPEDLDYDEVPSLRIEARQKLKKIRPSSIGQASRIAGVSPADVSVLLVWLSRK